MLHPTLLQLEYHVGQVELWFHNVMGEGAGVFEGDLDRDLQLVGKTVVQAESLENPIPSQAYAQSCKAVETCGICEGGATGGRGGRGFGRRGGARRAGSGFPTRCQLNELI